MKKGLNIVLIRSPQPYLITDKGELFSPNRLLAPEPTLPLLHGILQDIAKKNNLKIKVIQLDLRDSKNGKIIHNHYGDVIVPYIKTPLRKMCSGVSIDSQMNLIKEADIIGFTNNFTMARNVVRENISKVRKRFPDKEIWIGGRDVFPEYISNLYAESANKKNLIIFNGHVFSTLSEYIKYKIGKPANLHGITKFDKNGNKETFNTIPLTKILNNGFLSFPIPIFPDSTVLDRFNYSGEGPIEEGHGRFAHMTIGIGCPHICGYCTTGWRERYIVIRSMESIIKELELYKSLGVKTLAIMDDNLLSLGTEKINKIMNLINSYDFNIEYGNGLELGLLHKNWDQVHESVLKNCTVLYAPLEDLSGDVSYRKLEAVDKQKKLMKLIVNYFHNHAQERSRYVTMGVIIGVPGHTKKGLFQTLPKNITKFLEIFVNKNVGTAVTVFNYMPLSGTSFGDQAINSKQMITDIVRMHPEVVNFELCSYAPKGLTHKEVFDAYLRAISFNPAGRVDSHGNYLGSSYEHIKRYGEKILPEFLRIKLPSCWKELGKEFTGGRVAGAGLHYKAWMTPEIAKENKIKINTF